MNRAKFGLIVIISLVVLQFVLPGSTIRAQVRLCQPGTGTPSVACVPCTPGPYNICVEETGIIFTNDSDLSREDYLVIVSVMLIGISVLIGSLLLRQKAVKFL